MKLYISTDHPGRWIAYVPDSGWLVFPDSQNGWERREPVRGLDPIHMREVSARAAAGAGLEPASALKKVA
jgi:hypothetical protein